MVGNNNRGEKFILFLINPFISAITSGFGHDPQVDCGMFCCERFEPGERVVLRIVVHDDALPLCGRKILPHDRPERFDERCGTVVSGDDER